MVQITLRLDAGQAGQRYLEEFERKFEQADIARPEEESGDLVCIWRGADKTEAMVRQLAEDVLERDDVIFGFSADNVEDEEE